MDSRDWTDGSKRWYKTELKDAFTEEYQDFKYKPWFTSTLFNKWVKKYTEVKKLGLVEGKSNGQKYITIQEIPF